MLDNIIDCYPSLHARLSYPSSVLDFHPSLEVDWSVWCRDFDFTMFPSRNNQVVRDSNISEVEISVLNYLPLMIKKWIQLEKHFQWYPENLHDRFSICISSWLAQLFRVSPKAQAITHHVHIIYHLSFNSRLKQFLTSLSFEV